jgi:hypothetical protein
MPETPTGGPRVPARPPRDNRSNHTACSRVHLTMGTSTWDKTLTTAAIITAILVPIVVIWLMWSMAR